MTIPDVYGRDDDKDYKVEGGGEVDRPPAPGRLAQTDTLDPSIAGPPLFRLPR